MNALDGVSPEELVAEAGEVQRQIATLTTQLELLQLALRVKESQNPLKVSTGAASTHEDALPVTVATGRGERPPLKAAILGVMADEPGRVWTPTVVHAELDARGWGPRGSAARAQVSNRLASLLSSGQVSKLGKGRYVLATEGNVESVGTGLFSQTDSV
jgi:hypothetical protein